MHVAQTGRPCTASILIWVTTTTEGREGAAAARRTRPGRPPFLPIGRRRRHPHGAGRKIGLPSSRPCLLICDPTQLHAETSRHAPGYIAPRFRLFQGSLLRPAGHIDGGMVRDIPSHQQLQSRPGGQRTNPYDVTTQSA
ncbi:hypothetical protein ACCO45_010124 [Purpureocillium lilacinum]|uniref:Uncharacterized protein n=1 Tax=Purpureocillium lilacinum TaxID=33203 RepID=A0ACC4DEA9_PURLI